MDPAAAGSFCVRLVEQEAHHVVELGGMVCLDAAATLRNEASRLLVGQKDVAIDWSGAEHVDASALQVLLALERSLASSGRRLFVRADNATVRRYLELAGLGGYFEPEGEQTIAQNGADRR
jgi:anti-anti-sigma factor